jgi:hypothetical protein
LSGGEQQLARVISRENQKMPSGIKPKQESSCDVQQRKKGEAAKQE